MDFIIRYKTIDTEFSNLLKILNLKQVREFPKKNITKGKDYDFLSYYDSDKVKLRAYKFFIII